MPRIYAPNEAHAIDQGGVTFVNGAGAVPANAAAAIAYFTAKGYTIDNSKHSLELIDLMTPAELRQMCDYFQVTYDEGEEPDDKATLVRAIEHVFGEAVITDVIVTSAAGATTGKTKITLNPSVGTFRYKTAATTAPEPKYMDDVSAWTVITSGAEFTPTEGHDKITVVQVNAANRVLGIGDDDIVVKTT